MKKGQIGFYITVVVGLLIAIALFTGLAFPQVRTMTTAQDTTDSLTAHVLGAGDTVTTLSNLDLVTDGVSIAGLTLTTHYSVDYDAAQVTVLNATANGTFTAAYSYYAPGYIESTGARTMAAVVILLLIIGLAVGAFKMFGVI